LKDETEDPIKKPQVWAGREFGRRKHSIPEKMKAAERIGGDARDSSSNRLGDGGRRGLM